MALLCVGFETEPVTDWERFISPIKAPARWKDPLKIEAYLAEAQAKRANEISMSPFTAQFKNVVLLDAEGKHVPVESTTLETITAYSTIASFNVSLFKALCAAECIAKHGTVRHELRWIFATYHAHGELYDVEDEVTPPSIIDPMHTLAFSSEEHDPELFVARYCPDWKLFTGRYMAADRDALLCHKLCKLLGLTDTKPEKTGA